MTPTVYLCTSAFDVLLREASAWVGEETGGILIGYEAENAIVITTVTGPGRACRRTRHRIELDTTYIQAEVDKAARAGYQYQGSWHTHPTTGVLGPSAIDRRLLRAGAWSPRYKLRLAAAMLIVRDAVRDVEDILALTCAKRRYAIRRATLEVTRDPRPR
jgi:integrative and conjugative element protein (TIGR02256 family)